MNLINAINRLEITSDFIARKAKRSQEQSEIEWYQETLKSDNRVLLYLKDRYESNPNIKLEDVITDLYDKHMEFMKAGVTDESTESIRQLLDVIERIARSVWRLSRKYTNFPTDTNFFDKYGLFKFPSESIHRPVGKSEERPIKPETLERFQDMPKTKQVSLPEKPAIANMDEKSYDEAVKAFRNKTYLQMYRVVNPDSKESDASIIVNLIGKQYPFEELEMLANKNPKTQEIYRSNYYKFIEEMTGCKVS